MAIDTAEKRRAAVAPCFAYLNPGVTPSSTHDATWRQRVGHSMGALAAPAAQVTQAEELVYVRGRQLLTRSDPQGKAL